MITPCDTDINILLALNGDAGSAVDTVMWYVSAKLTWVPLYATLIWLVWSKDEANDCNTGRWKTTVAFIIAAALIVLLADQTATLCKSNFPKFRPTHYPPLEGMVHTVRGYVGGLYGTISSHAANSAGIAVFSSLVIRRRFLSWSLVAWVLLVSYSRIYLGVHYPVDLLLGLIEGSLWGFLVYKLMNHFRWRVYKHQKQ